MTITALAVILLSFPLSAQTNYAYNGGTTWAFTRVITEEDPSSYKKVDFTGITTAKMYDRDANDNQGDWVYPEVYMYKLSYDDNIESEIRIRKKDFSQQEADQTAARYGHKMGQLPACLRRGVHYINILKSDALFGGNNWEKSIEITIGKTSEDYERVGNMEETLFHEATHAALDNNYRNDDWTASRDADGKFVSKYAYDNPNREDISESFLCYVGARFKAPRIYESDMQKLNAYMPERMVFFEQFDNDMYPIVRLNGKPAPSSGAFDPGKYYRLTTQFLGEEKSLDVINDAQKDKVKMADSGNYSGQHWKLQDLGNGYYRLTTRFLGEEKSLDIINDASRDKLKMAKTGNYSGQYWKIKDMGNGYYRLTTQFLGEEKSLDVINDAKKDKLRMAKSGSYSGQLWKITEVR
jgi:hypothetical protein